MASNTSVRNVDPELLARLAGMSAGEQRWLRTALLAVTSNDQLIPEAQLRAPLELERRRPPAAETPPPTTLEDVINGKANLKDHLEAFPELAEELDGLAEIIDLLREAGERRRSKGEQILRDEILGEEAGADEDYRL